MAIDITKINVEEFSEDQVEKIGKMIAALAAKKRNDALESAKASVTAHKLRFDEFEWPVGCGPVESKKRATSSVATKAPTPYFIRDKDDKQVQSSGRGSLASVTAWYKHHGAVTNTEKKKALALLKDEKNDLYTGKFKWK